MTNRSHDDEHQDAKCACALNRQVLKSAARQGFY
jgi:hypothetical protein